MTDNSRNNTLRLIKKYANRRLYDTHTSSHSALADVRQLVIESVPFQVVDAKSGEDLTRSISLQIIQEAKSDGEPIFSIIVSAAESRAYGIYGLAGQQLAARKRPD